MAYLQWSNGYEVLFLQLLRHLFVFTLGSWLDRQLAIETLRSVPFLATLPPGDPYSIVADLHLRFGLERETTGVPVAQQLDSHRRGISRPRMFFIRSVHDNFLDRDAEETCACINLVLK